MGPEDATNLLMAILYDGELADAHETVVRLSKATLTRVQHRRWEQFDYDYETLPRNGWLVANGEALSLGEVIQTMLDWKVRYGHLYEAGADGEEDIDLEPVNIRLEVSTPGYRASLTFNTPCSLFWRLDYEWKPPEQLKYEAENYGKLIATRWDARNGSHIWSSRTVCEDCLRAIADCLRGSELTDDWDEFVPPYDQGETANREAEVA
jgi:hypothetical protein